MTPGLLARDALAFEPARGGRRPSIREPAKRRASVARELRPRGPGVQRAARRSCSTTFGPASAIRNTAAASAITGNASPRIPAGRWCSSWEVPAPRWASAPRVGRSLSRRLAPALQPEPDRRRAGHGTSRRAPGVRGRPQAGRRAVRVLAAVLLHRRQLVRTQADPRGSALAHRPADRPRLLSRPGPHRGANARPSLEPALGIARTAARPGLPEMAAERSPHRLDVGQRGRLGLETRVRLPTGIHRPSAIACSRPVATSIGRSSRTIASRPSADRAFREAVAIAREHGATVGLLYLPESSEFRSWYTPNAERLAREHLAATRSRTRGARYQCPRVDGRWTVRRRLPPLAHRRGRVHAETRSGDRRRLPGGAAMIPGLLARVRLTVRPKQSSAIEEIAHHARHGPECFRERSSS